MLSIIFVSASLLFILAYKTYGSWIARQMGENNNRPTPAHTRRDGVDYVPTPTAIVFGHHFSSIAGAGPIVGAIAAASVFGWGAALLWLVLGVIFIGMVHDYSTLFASIRHNGQGLAAIGRKHLSPIAYRGLLLFMLALSIYVIITFLDMTADTFAPTTAPWGASVDDNSRIGGIVATASVFTIFIAVVFGFILRKWHPSLLRITLIMVPLAFFGLVVGNYFPLDPSFVPALFGSDKYFWSAILLLYCMCASVLPVWAVLQPRDYLSSFLLYACLAIGAIGIFAGTFGGTATITWPVLKTWSSPVEGNLYPALFVMIACGAVSGFHSLVSTSTTSKQIKSEHAARRVGMGAMLVESILAILALSTVMTLPADATPGVPTNVFANGIARLCTPLHPSQACFIQPGWIRAFILLAVSTFLLTTLDTITRIARMILQELLGVSHPGALQRILLTTLVLLPALLVFCHIPGPNGNPIPVWRAIWPAFGATNQMLAALALLMVYSWLRGLGKPAWYVLFPVAFMFTTTLIALYDLIRLNLFRTGGSHIIGGLCLLIFILALVVLADVILNFIRHPRPPYTKKSA